jgi:glycosyltransferase involved in cell wall biosynthesis
MDPANRDLGAQVGLQRCEDLVLPLGSRTDVQDLGRALDLHILSSSGGEAFPNVVAETLLSGTPNLVTDVGDSALMVHDSGWIVPARQPQQMADAIAAAWREWADDRPAWTERRAAARLQIAGRFTFDRMLEAYQDVWRTVATLS